MAAANGSGLSKWSGIIAGAVAVISVVGSMIAQIYTMQDRLSRMEVSLNEIETQLCGVSRDVNRMHANDLRTMALLWKRAFGEDYPIGNAYYPEYGQCQNSPKK
jgi:hypothetical protein